MPKIAIAQLNSGVDPEANFALIHASVTDAADQGAEIVFLPEMALLLDRDRTRAGAVLDSPSYAQFSARFAALARASGVDIALGSMPLRKPNGMMANRSHYFRASGAISPHYDKIHMFDVELSTGETWRESRAYEPGETVIAIDNTPIGKLGLTICYDLRFPDLFSALGKRRCDAIAVPAAFTRPTGAAHWHIMLRARAIEASAFVIAAAQVGKHEDGRETYGHSLVVDPWGEVLLEMDSEEPGLGFCDVDLSRIAEVRAQVPSLANAREIPN